MTHPPVEATVLGGFLFALASSAHCAGMCGVFALQAAGVRRRPLRSGLYILGKTFTYVFLGALAGALGAGVASRGALWQSVLGFAVAAVLLAAGWRALRPQGAAPSRAGAAFARAIQPVVSLLRDAERVGGPAALGAATGLLPCGVVYMAAAAAAATASPVRGALLMGAFGLGTAPVLLFIGLAGQGLLARLGASRLRTAGGILILAMGLFTLHRAAMPLLHAAAGGPVSCH